MRREHAEWLGMWHVCALETCMHSQQHRLVCAQRTVFCLVVLSEFKRSAQGPKHLTGRAKKKE